MQFPDSFWRSLYHLNRFRGFLAIFFLLVALVSDPPLLGQRHLPLFFALGLLYGGLAWLFHPMVKELRPAFERQLLLQVVADVVLLTTFMYLSEGNESGVGLLMIIPMAAAGLLPKARHMLFASALAAVAVLLEQALNTLWWQDGVIGFLRAGLLATGFFMVSGFSHVLAKGALSSAELVGQQAAQVDNLAKINARIIRDLPYGVLVVDQDGRVIHHNARAEDMLACNVFSQARLNHCSPALHGMWNAWRTQGRPADKPIETGGEGRRVRVRFTELEPTRSAGAVILLEDMTELEREAQNMKLAALGRLTANLAHEIRNPLAAIHQAGALLAEEPANATMARLTRIIDDNTKRLNDLVEDVLLLNRRDRMEQEAVPAAEFLREFVAHFQQAEQVPAGIIVLSVPGHVRLKFDRLHLNQIVWNLARNAWRHCTRQAGSIQLRLVAAEGRGHIEVFNNGEPISAEMQARLFEPFYTTDKRGTGLGLYIARELAEANGASLRYVDQAGGALFRVTALLANEAQAARENPTP